MNALTNICLAQDPGDEEADQDMELTVEMPADIVAALRVAGFQRRSLGYHEVAISSLIREAVEEWLEREISGTSSIDARL